jgi:polynucleotide 5'-kinase involved in rRNA processing
VQPAVNTNFAVFPCPDDLPSTFQVEERLASEEARAQRYCHPSSVRKVRDTVMQELIISHMERIHNEFESMLEQRRLEGKR